MQNSSVFQYLAPETAHESATNPRCTFDEAKLYELAQIPAARPRPAIAVRPNSSGFEIVASQTFPPLG